MSNFRSSYFIKSTLLNFLITFNFGIQAWPVDFDVHLQTVDGTERISAAVKELLYEEQILHNKGLHRAGAFSTNIRPEYIPENRPKFPLSYFLIPAESANFSQSLEQ